MKPVFHMLDNLRAGANGFWLARSEQERRMLRFGAASVALALVYALLIAPALDGRAKLQKDLPQLRLDAAEIAALATQAGALARQTPAPVPPMSRDSLSASLTARGLSAQSISMTGEYAKLQLNGAAFAGLAAWLDALRRESRIEVQDANLVAQPTAGLVDATLTLRQGAGEAK
ncbi:MAG TPA: general secretion pathway protein GspM [Janthinobacterium sp.]|nr:general secretion pathway protein GspM [Janthinobacterium sp.]